MIGYIIGRFRYFKKIGVILVERNNDPDYDVCLYGTCGESSWRESFIKRYLKEGIMFFNPQKQNWTKNDITNEYFHLVDLKSRILVFVITDETYSFESLRELGVLINTFKKKRVFRYVLIKIDIELNKNLKKNKSLYKKSKQLRLNLLRKINRIKNKWWGQSMMIFDSIEDVLSFSLVFYKVLKNIAHNF